MSLKKRTNNRSIIQKMLTKFKDKVILAILVLVVIGSIIIKVVGSINEEIKCDLEHRYYSQNNAFLIDCKYNESMQYQSSDKSDLPRLAVHIYVYNNIQDDYNVTVDEVLNYLSEEYDSSGKPYVYSCPDNINAYIECYPEVNIIAFDFGIRFMIEDYNNEKMYPMKAEKKAKLFTVFNDDTSV